MFFHARNTNMETTQLSHSSSESLKSATMIQLFPQKSIFPGYPNFPPHPCFQAVEAGEMLGYPLMWIYFSEKRMIREAAEAAKPRPPPPSQET